MGEWPVLVRNLEFSYEGQKNLLSIDSFGIAGGERVFLHGPSGCGKTTLLGILAGVLPASPGTVRILGRDAGSMSRAARDRLRGESMGYIFQQFNLIPSLTVRENILLPLRLNRRDGAEGQEERLREIAANLGIREILEAKANRISVGQAQRTAGARALLPRPSLIFADEPTASLDVSSGRDFLNTLLELARRENAGVLFVGHDLRTAVAFDRVVDFQELNRVRWAG